MSALNAPQPETQALIDFLKTTKTGETITYERIAREVGYSVTEQPGRNRLNTARKYLMREHQRVFATVLRVGIKALNDGETVELGSRSLGSIRNAARRAKRITLSIRDYDALPPVEKSRQQAVLAISSAVESVASMRAVKALTQPAVMPITDMGGIVDAIRSAMKPA